MNYMSAKCNETPSCKRWLIEEGVAQAKVQQSLQDDIKHAGSHEVRIMNWSSTVHGWSDHNRGVSRILSNLGTWWALYIDILRCILAHFQAYPNVCIKILIAIIIKVKIVLNTKNVTNRCNIKRIQSSGSCHVYKTC